MGEARQGSATHRGDVGLGHDHPATLTHALDIAQGQTEGGGLGGAPSMIQPSKSPPGGAKLRSQKVGLGGRADPILALVCPFEGHEEEGPVLNEGAAQRAAKLKAAEAIGIDPRRGELGRGIEWCTGAACHEELTLPCGPAGAGFHAHDAIGASAEPGPIGGGKDLKAGQSRERKLDPRPPQKALPVVEAIQGIGRVEGVITRDGERGCIPKKRCGLRDARDGKGQGQGVSGIGWEGLDFSGFERSPLRGILGIQAWPGAPPDHRDGIELKQGDKGDGKRPELTGGQGGQGAGLRHHPRSLDREFARHSGRNNQAEGPLSIGLGRALGTGDGLEAERCPLHAYAGLAAHRPLEGAGPGLCLCPKRDGQQQGEEAEPQRHTSEGQGEGGGERHGHWVA